MATSNANLLAAVFFLISSMQLFSPRALFAFKPCLTGPEGMDACSSSDVLAALENEKDREFQGHMGITLRALPSMKNEPLSEVLDSLENLDASWNLMRAGVDPWHFNDCAFSESVDNINDLYKDVIKKIKRKNYNGAASTFGEILHVAQDFYAHSNWVESGRVDLLDAGDGDWSELFPWSPVPNRSDHSTVLIIESEPPPGFLILPETGKGNTIDKKTVSVKTPEGKEVPGIVSGTATMRHSCPTDASIGHWEPTDPVDQPWDVPIWRDFRTLTRLRSENSPAGLNKDDPHRPCYAVAACLSVVQTRHEFCRLISLVKKNSPLDATVGTDLIKQWFEDSGEAEKVLEECRHPGKATESCKRIACIE